LKTDSIFYRIFQTDPGILFELLGQSADRAQGYEFRSVEIKQLAFRIDGVLLPKPDAPDRTVWFVEVQFQKDQHFYHRFFAEIGLYLAQHPKTEDWQAVVLFPNRKLEPEQRHLYRAQLNSDQVHRVYLNELKASEALGVGLVQLILARRTKTMAQVQMLLSRADIQSQTNPKITEIIKLIETIIVYKFPQLSREEIEGMFGLSELRKTKVYQEALLEGKQEGKQEGLDHERSLILRMLERRVGKISQKARSQVLSLSFTELDSLGEALLDFSAPSDLKDWLLLHNKTT
jgi:predicted transposase/invertase (TIGR01784 family)